MPDLYYALDSPPCRAVLLTAKALNINLNLKVVDFDNEEHLKPAFLKLNPAHTVPTLVDDGFSIYESRAILCYLVNKYGKGSTLYPEEPKARAQVDQRLYFDIGTLYGRFADYFYPQLFVGAPADPARLAKIYEAFQLLDLFLEGETYVAGPNVTIADISLIAGISSFEASDVDYKKYPNVVRWFDNLKNTLAGYKEINEKGVEEFKDWVKSMRK